MNLLYLKLCQTGLTGFTCTVLFNALLCLSGWLVGIQNPLHHKCHCNLNISFTPPLLTPLGQNTSSVDISLQCESGLTLVSLNIYIMRFSSVNPSNQLPVIYSICTPLFTLILLAFFVCFNILFFTLAFFVCH